MSRLYIKKKPRQYAMYKGEECLAIGTRQEICQEMNIKEQTFRYYRSTAYRERLEKRKERNARRIIRLED